MQNIKNGIKIFSNANLVLIILKASLSVVMLIGTDLVRQNSKI